MNESLFSFRNPTENTLKSFQVFSRFPFFEKKRKPRNDTLAKENTRLELEICTLQNELIEYQHSSDVIEAKVF
jgi:cell division protein FtsB